MKLQESAENYLETILILKNKNGAVRSIDIAQFLNFSKPSISRAMSLLRENQYITMDKEGWIELTDAGKQIAEGIFERHEKMTAWLISIGVSPEAAASDACRMEHIISEETFQRICALQKNEKG